jgi:hypothetical protein
MLIEGHCLMNEETLDITIGYEPGTNELGEVESVYGGGEPLIEELLIEFVSGS